jgi:uncharacterized Zn-binding protein involved in type VI secretion
MMPCARITDMHVCPLLTGLVPHVGGPIMPPGVPTVLVGMLPAAPLGNLALCAAPAPDVIVMGSATVLTGGRPQARILDPCAHGGVIVAGLPTVLVGG